MTAKSVDALAFRCTHAAIAVAFLIAIGCVWSALTARRGRLLGVAVGAFAFVQEMQAERAVEALAEFQPPHATVVRDGTIR